MVDELDFSRFSASNNTRDKLKRLASKAKYVWIAFTFTNQVQQNIYKFIENNETFKLQELHVMFRNSQHISKIHHRFMQMQHLVSFAYPLKLLHQKTVSGEDSSFSPYEKPVIGGCFQSSQPQVQVKYVKELKDCLTIPTTDFLKPEFRSDRLAVIFSDKNAEDEDKIDWHTYFTFLQNMLATINDSTVVIVFYNDFRRSFRDYVSLFGGSEFKSVLIICDHFQEKPALGRADEIDKAVTRAQLEVGFIVPESFKKEEEWLNFISATDDHSVQTEFCQFIYGEQTLRKNWLHPKIRSDPDYNWLQKRFLHLQSNPDLNKIWFKFAGAGHIRYAVELAAVTKTGFCIKKDSKDGLTQDGKTGIENDETNNDGKAWKTSILQKPYKGKTSFYQLP